jgi:hypothetical protein
MRYFENLFSTKFDNSVINKLEKVRCFGVKDPATRNFSGYDFAKLNTTGKCGS